MPGALGFPGLRPRADQAADVYAATLEYRPLNVRLFGAAGDGASDDRDVLHNVANNVIPSDGGAMLLSRLADAGAVYAVMSDVTIPSHVALVVEAGAKIQPASGVTVTVNGPVVAGGYEIFDTSAGGSFAVAAASGVLRAAWFGDDHVILTAPVSGPTTGDMPNGSVAASVDESADDLVFTVKKSDGSVVTGTVALT
ncbi:MAG: hypothetical protein ACODAE_07695 [Gemmatimonadota bacterium]